MKRLVSFLAALAAVCLVMAGCSGAPPTLDAAQLALAADGTLEVIGTRAAMGETQTATQLWPTPTDVPPTATPTPPATLTPSPTSTDTPTETPTATATPLPRGTVLAAGWLRAGPGNVYPTVAQLAGGETATPLGQTAAGDWFLIALDGVEGWLPSENFALSAETGELPIITELPPTPTVPPATLTPVSTATSSPSPFSCDVSISPGASPLDIIVVGQGWPPDMPITLVYTGATYSFTNTWDFHSGAVGSTNPGGFWHTMRGEPGTYTFSTQGCSRSVVY
jgi:hypothetical protein